MELATHQLHRNRTSAPPDGSRTITLHDAQPRADLDGVGSGQGQGEGSNSNATAAVGTLRLRGVAPRSTQRVMWREDVVDNEGCGKKKSKICCIFRKRRRFDESSSESESDSGSDSDVSPCDDIHGHGHGCGYSLRRRRGPNGKDESDRDEDAGSDSGSDRNAYERLPKSQRKERMKS
ncbi:phosphatase inhibitor-domain-containing protein [Scleroderma citrinum]